MLPIQYWATHTQTPVYFVCTPILPILDLRVIFDAGSARDEENPGIAQITHNLLYEGTAKLSAEKIAERFENIGAIFGTFHDQDVAVVSLRTLTYNKFLMSALKTFITLLNAPLFSKEGLDHQKKMLISLLEHQEQSPSDLAENAFFSALYRDHPYATPVNGTKESVLALEPEQISNFYKQYYTAQNARIVMVGDLKLKQAEKMANEISENLPQGKRARKLLIASSATIKEIKKIQYSSTQTHVFMGKVGINHSDSDYFSFCMGNYILGGDPSISKLGQSVREKEGLVYDIRSYFLPLTYRGPFLISFQTQAKKASFALEVVRKTLVDFISKKPLCVELQRAKDHIVKGYSLHFDSNSAIIGNLVELAFYDLPLDYFNTFTGKILAVTEDQIFAAFKKYIDPDKMVVVLVGK